MPQREITFYKHFNIKTIKNNYLMYLNNDPAQPNDSLIDYHADLLSQAGIDFITLDLTNGVNQPINGG